MKKSRKLAPSKYLRKYGKAKISRPMITKEEVEAVLECAITDERYEELLEASRLYSLSNSDKHVNLAQDAEHNQDWEGAKKHWKNAALASIKHDTIHKTQRSDKLKVRGITMRKGEKVDEAIELSASRKEEVETITELSKRTLGSYIKKAHVDAVETGYSQGIRRPTSNQEDDDWVSDKNNSRMDKRERGTRLAVKKLTKEEVEQIDELSHEVLGSYITKAVKNLVKDRGGTSNVRRTSNRARGIQLAAKKLTTTSYHRYNRPNFNHNEEVETITELSSEKLKKYVKKANKQKVDLKMRSKYAPQLNDVIPLVRKLHKRERGVNKASKTLRTRAFYDEEVEQIDELRDSALIVAAGKRRKCACGAPKAPYEAECDRCHDKRHDPDNKARSEYISKSEAHKEEVEQIDEKDKYQVQRVHDYGAGSSYNRTFARHASASQHADQYRKQNHAKYGHEDDDDSAVRVRKVDPKTPVGENPSSYHQEKKKAFRSNAGNRLRGKAFKKARHDWYGDESVEQIDELETITELSNEKKTQYIKRAEQSRDMHNIHTQHYIDRSKTAKGAASLSTDKLKLIGLGQKHLLKSLKRSIGADKARLSMKKEAVELSASRKDKVNSLLAKHQAKGLPKKSAKKYTREYTGNGLPLIAAVINQEETLNETKE